MKFPNLLSQNAMKVHLRTHTDILPYVCNFCHRRFREKGSVIRHKRTHTGEKPYQCRHCGRAFAEHGTLNRHLKAKGIVNIGTPNNFAVKKLKPIIRGSTME